jgi:biopolymer transport protein ExbD
MVMNFKTRLKPAYNLIDLTPLVDVVFLLLVFFIVTSDVLPLKSLNVENPGLAKNSLPLTTQLIVVMDKQHVIYVGSKKDIVDYSSVKDHLTKEIYLLKETHQEAHPTIVLSVDKHVDYGSFLKLFSLIQELGLPIRLSYKTQEV